MRRGEKNRVHPRHALAPLGGDTRELGREYSARPDDLQCPRGGGKVQDHAGNEASLWTAMLGSCRYGGRIGREIDVAGVEGPSQGFIMQYMIHVGGGGFELSVNWSRIHK